MRRNFKNYEKVCGRIRSCCAVTNASGTVPRVVETVRNKQVSTEKKPATNTPIRRHTRTPYGYPHVHRGSCVPIFLPSEQKLKTEIIHKAPKRTWPEKNQLRVEKTDQPTEQICATTDKELHNLICGTFGINFVIVT